MSMAGKTRVLIVDDSALVRQMLTAIIAATSDLEVVGTAADPYIARDKIKRLNPDVLTLDVEMPRMDGLTFLSNLMRLRPMPVVMVSSMTAQGADTTLRALELGAVDFVAKPKLDISRGLQGYADEICDKIRGAAQARVSALENRVRQVTPKRDADAVLARNNGSQPLRTTDCVIAIGASTGGTEAIKAVLGSLPADAPGIVIAQHIPAAFSRPFAERMDRCSELSVCQASDGQQILPGHAYIAPGDQHLLVERDGARYICRLHRGPQVNRHRPSVDVLLRSVAQHVGSNGIGAVLTGMGDDGARGLLEMRQAGAHTLAQDEASSVVWGMPGEAVKLGAANETLALPCIAQALLAAADRHHACGSCHTADPAHASSS
jgi:two-component system chemotaxis response regulator CheB